MEAKERKNLILLQMETIFKGQLIQFGKKTISLQQYVIKANYPD